MLLQVNAAAAQAEAALTAFQQGLPLPPSAIEAPAALAPGSAGAAMAAAGNLAAGGHAAGGGVLPGVQGLLPGAVPGLLPGVGGLLGGAAGLAALVPTPFVVVNGMISSAVLEDDEEYEEVGGACGARAFWGGVSRGPWGGGDATSLLMSWDDKLSSMGGCSVL
jgi:hypothetical protein